MISDPISAVWTDEEENEYCTVIVSVESRVKSGHQSNNLGEETLTGLGVLLNRVYEFKEYQMGFVVLSS